MYVLVRSPWSLVRSSFGHTTDYGLLTTDEQMKLALLGYGKMGRMVEEAAAREGIDIVCIIDPIGGSRGELVDADVCIDFTEPHVVIEDIKAAAAARASMVVGTTGWYDRIDEAR